METKVDITTLQFKPDFVWIKNMGSDWHHLVDVVRIQRFPIQ